MSTEDDIKWYIHTYITLHYITLHYITLHYITLHYIHTYIYIYTFKTFVYGWNSSFHEMIFFILKMNKHYHFCGYIAIAQIILRSPTCSSHKADDLVSQGVCALPIAIFLYIFHWCRVRLSTKRLLSKSTTKTHKECITPSLVHLLGRTRVSQGVHLEDLSYSFSVPLFGVPKNVKLWFHRS